MSQSVHLEKMHTFDCGGTVVYQLLCGRDLGGSMMNFIYLVVNTHDMTAIAIDAAWDIDAVYAFALKLGVELKGSVYTHWHFDHAGGEGIPGCCDVLRRGGQAWAGEFDIERIRTTCTDGGQALIPLADGDFVALGALSLHIVHTPGHTSGSICIVVSAAGKLTPRFGPPTDDGIISVPARNGLLISGDTLFIGGAGRADIPDSNWDRLLASLARLTALPSDMLVLPGHNYDPLAYTSLDIEAGGNTTVLSALSSPHPVRPLPCCCCTGLLGPKKWAPGARVEFVKNKAGNLSVLGEEDHGMVAGEMGLVESWSEESGAYVLRLLRDLGSTRVTVPFERLKERGRPKVGHAAVTNPVCYVVMHGTIFRKADPISGSGGIKIVSTRKAIGTVVWTTGRVWIGSQGTSWVELDPIREKRAGWLALHGKVFGIDAELLRLEPHK